MRAARPDAELVAGRLWDLGSTGIEEQDGETGGAVVLIAAFPSPAATEAAAAELGAEVVTVDDDLWQDTWRPYAEPVDVGAALRVVPAWRADEGGDGQRLSLLIDPGPCFGSGSHATTRTLLAALEDVVVPGVTVLDVGTGSGVLAVAAARLGAARVEAIDIDAASVAVTAANARANGVEGSVHASVVPLADVAGRFDVVLANLSAATLCELAPKLMAATAPGGRLLVSGMLTGQWRHVLPAFTSMVAERVMESEGWTSAMLLPAPASG